MSSVYDSPLIGLAGGGGGCGGCVAYGVSGQQNQYPTLSQVQAQMANFKPPPLPNAFETWKILFEDEQRRYREDQERAARRRTRIAGYITGGLASACLIEGLLA